MAELFVIILLLWFAFRENPDKKIRRICREEIEKSKAPVVDEASLVSFDKKHGLDTEALRRSTGQHSRS